jgi:hypothetical protein
MVSITRILATRASTIISPFLVARKGRGTCRIIGAILVIASCGLFVSTLGAPDVNILAAWGLMVTAPLVWASGTIGSPVRLCGLVSVLDHG